MGVKIFRENNWDRLEAGMISLWDIRGLDREKDRRLIEYLILKGRDRLKEKIMRQYGIAEMPEEPVNIDDPEDEIYRTYFVLREQVEREDDAEVLKTVAFRKQRDSLGRFAFRSPTGSISCRRSSLQSSSTCGSSSAAPRRTAIRGGMRSATVRLVARTAAFTVPV